MHSNYIAINVAIIMLALTLDQNHNAIIISANLQG